MSENETEAAKAWDNIEAGHGLVAVDPQWAASQDLPHTMGHPKDSSKVVYVIEAYHEIHCLVSQQSSFCHKLRAHILTGIPFFGTEVYPRALHGSCRWKRALVAHGT